MIIQLQATQTGSGEDRSERRSPIYHISLRGLVGIATPAFCHRACVRSHECIPHTSTCVCIDVCVCAEAWRREHVQILTGRSIVITQENSPLSLTFSSHVRALALSPTIPHTQLLSLFLTLSQCHSLRHALSLSVSVLPLPRLWFSHGELPVLCSLFDETGQPSKLSRVVSLYLFHSALITTVSEQRGILSLQDCTNVFSVFFTDCIDAYRPYVYLGKYS